MKTTTKEILENHKVYNPMLELDLLRYLDEFRLELLATLRRQTPGADKEYKEREPGGYGFTNG